MTTRVDPRAINVAAGGKPAAATLANVSMSYDGRLEVLHDINFTLGEGEFLSIVGPSGCGKSTILRLISGLQKPTGGRIEFGTASHQANIGFMFQRDALLPWADVNANIAVGLECAGVPKEQHGARTDELLKLLGLSDFGHYYPRALSGGMRQRVALGRLLAYDPQIMLMDEPFGALDELTRLEMNDLLLDIRRVTGATVLFVTHSIAEAIYLSDRVLVFSKRPATIAKELRVDIPYPRSAQSRFLPEFHELEREAGVALGVVKQ